MYNLYKSGKTLCEGGTYMETSNMKNMVVLKNLPSNIVDEAIIVLKTNKKVKKLQKIEKKRTQNDEGEKKDKQYILKEAEMLVNKYISDIEKNDKKNIFNKGAKEKYNKLKKYSIAITVMCIIQTLIIIF